MTEALKQEDIEEIKTAEKLKILDYLAFSTYKVRYNLYVKLQFSFEFFFINF